jgi:Zn-dependent protease with chaperone function
MTCSVILGAYAAVTAFGGPAALSRGWSRRDPRLAMGLWLALLVSWVAAVAVAGLALAVPSILSWVPSRGQAAAGLGGTPTGTAAAASGLLLAAAVTARAGWHVALGLGQARREHRRQAAVLAAAGRPDPALGVVVLDDDSPAAYCLPRGNPRVVVSAGTLSLLAPGQLRAVLAHERAHLRGRHHLTLAVAGALARAFPSVPLLARAGAELAVLAEMAADDAAVRRHDRGDLAAALVILARAGVRTTALTAGGPAALARIQRLLAPVPRPRLPARTAGLAAGVAALATATVIACLPLTIVACAVVGGR